MAERVEVPRTVTPPDASLSRLLTLVEQWQVWSKSDPGPGLRTDEEAELINFPVFNLRAAAQQHAEALRGLYGYQLTHSGIGYEQTKAAADFLSPKEEA